MWNNLGWIEVGLPTCRGIESQIKYLWYKLGPRLQTPQKAGGNFGSDVDGAFLWALTYNFQLGESPI